MAQPAFGNITSISKPGTEFNVSSTAHNHNGTALLVWLGAGYLNTGMPTSVTWDGVALTKVGEELSGAFLKSQLWLLEDATPGTQTLAVNNTEYSWYSIAVLSVNAFGSLGTPVVAGGYVYEPDLVTASVSTVTENDLVFAACVFREVDNGGVTATVTGTERYNVVVGSAGFELRALGSTSAGSGTVAVSFNPSENTFYSSIAVRLLGTSTTTYPPYFTSRSHYVQLKLTDGTAATGLAHNSPGLVASYTRVGATRTALPLVTQTVTGAWASGGFVEVSSTNAPGLYRLDLPDAAGLGGTAGVVVSIKGVGLQPYHEFIPFEIPVELTGTAVAGTLTTTTFSTAGLGLTASQANRRLLQFVEGPAAGERVLVVGINGSGLVQVAPPLTAAPADGNRFVLL